MPNDRENGTVKFFVRKYGFIARDSGAADAYLGLDEVERAGMGRDPREGDRISFIAWRQSRGDAATQLEFITSEKNNG
jgi:cold shock CspA family protein